MNNRTEENPDESWLLPYSDLMTLLLALFIVLYSVSAVNVSKLEELSQAFKTAFSDGLSIFDKSTIVHTGDITSHTDMTRSLRPSGKQKSDSRGVQFAKSRTAIFGGAAATTQPIYRSRTACLRSWRHSSTIRSC